MHGLQPQTQRDVAGLENGADRHAEWLAALVALVDANPGGLALEFADAVNAATMWAHRPFWPNPGLKIGIGGFFVVKVLGI